jgi:pimeloyl-ACP methyl ester carboxylesterase
MTSQDAEAWRDPRLGPAHEVRPPVGADRYHAAGQGPVLVFRTRIPGQREHLAQAGPAARRQVSLHLGGLAARLAPGAERSFDKPVLLAWAAEDRVFPLAHAERYATALGADLRTIADAYTYTAEDQPERTAELLDGLLRGS